MAMLAGEPNEIVSRLHDQDMSEFISTEAAALRARVSRSTIQRLCGNYRRRITAAVEAAGAAGAAALTEAELAPRMGELRCLWPANLHPRRLHYAVRAADVEVYPWNRPDPVTGRRRRGRPAGHRPVVPYARRTPPDQDVRRRSVQLTRGW